MIRKTATVLAAAGCLALAACSADTPTDTTAATSSTSSSASAPATTSAALTAEDQAYLADLIDGDIDPGFVAANGPRLVTLGQEVCADYRRGVGVVDEGANIVKVLLAEPTYEQDLAGSEQVRRGQAALASITIGFAAREHYCLDVTPT